MKESEYKELDAFRNLPLYDHDDDRCENVTPRGIEYKPGLKVFEADTANFPSNT